MARVFLPLSVALLCACGGSPMPSANLAGNWGGYALTTFSLQQPSYAYNVVAVAVSGETATISGICGGYVAPVIGPGTVSATVTSIGTGTYATFLGNLVCPATRQGSCDAVVVTYKNVGVLAGMTNEGNDPAVNGPLTLSYAASGTSSGCGIINRLQTSLTGYLVPAPE